MTEKKTEVDFKVKLRFTGEYPEDKVKDLMQKIADALYHEYQNGEGFAPDDMDDVLTDGADISYCGTYLLDNYYGEKGQREIKTLDFTPYND